MFCIKCLHFTTRVTNSRPHKKQASIWRRRACPRCKTVFTTIEQPSLADNSTIHQSDGSTTIFNIGKLIISIATAFSHDTKKSQYDSYWLARTVEATLTVEYSIITADDIAAVTHQVLKRFDELAAIQYAAKHRLIAMTRRRGRPSLSPSERAQQTGASPSR